jgi:hypothetical protein
MRRRRRALAALIVTLVTSASAHAATFETELGSPYPAGMNGYGVVA